MADNNLNFDELTAGQSNKEVTVNTADAALSAAGNNHVDIDLSSGNVNLSVTQQTRNILIKCSGHTVARTLGIHTNVGGGANSAQRLFLIENGGTAALTITDQDSGGGSDLVLAAGVTAVIHIDGTEIQAVLTNGNAAQVSDWKESVRVATDAAGTLASDFENGDTVDGVTLATGDRILIKDQASASENGIYTVNASGAPTRAADFVNPLVSGGAAVVVEEGTANADTIWGVTNNGAVDVGTDNLAFAELGGGGGASTLLGLTDTPSSFASQALKILRVNSTPDAVEFVDHNHDLAAQFGGALPAATNAIWKFVATRAITIPANLAGLQAHLGTAPSGGTLVIDLDQNGTTIGSITFNASSQTPDTLSTTSGTAKSISVGDRLELVIDTTNGSPADLALTIKARKTE